MGLSRSRSESVVIFGSSNMFSDIYDCCYALHKPIREVVVNILERERPRTKSLESRLREFGANVKITQLVDFRPRAGEDYFVAISAAEKSALVDVLEREFRIRFTSLVHPTAYVSPFATVGVDVFVGARAVIAPGAVIEDHVFINRSVSIGHDTVVRRYSRLQPGANIGGHCTIGEMVTIGIGANVLHELLIGGGAVVGGGATVIRDVAPGAVVVGVPARPVAERQ
jgi:sugar O-acyltransferase (sialic acid O-acetyltransferase NeuD family)